MRILVLFMLAVLPQAASLRNSRVLHKQTACQGSCAQQPCSSLLQAWPHVPNGPSCSARRRVCFHPLPSFILLSVFPSSSFLLAWQQHDCREQPPLLSCCTEKQQRLPGVCSGVRVKMTVFCLAGLILTMISIPFLQFCFVHRRLASPSCNLTFTCSSRISSTWRR